MLIRICTYCTLSALLFLCKIVSAQYYPIPDDNFRAYLSTMPHLFNNDGLLIIEQARAQTGAISCQDLNIKDLSGLQFFHNIEMLNCANNQISTLPPLDSLVHLKSMWVYGNNLTDLPDLSNLKNLEVLNFKMNKFTTFPSIKGLISLKELDCSLNALDTIPSLNELQELENLYCYQNNLKEIRDISALTNLKLLNVQNNQLRSLPDISHNDHIQILQFDQNMIESIPDLSHMTELEELIASYNNITYLPDLSSNIKLRKLWLERNQIKLLSEMTSLTSLREVRLDQNLLTFEYLIPLAEHQNFTGFSILPQDTLFNFRALTINEGTAMRIELDQEAHTEGNIYHWTRDGQYLTTTREPYLQIDRAGEEHQGKYVVRIQNEHQALGHVNLYARAAVMEKASCIVVQSIAYHLRSNDCKDGADIELDDSAILGNNRPFTYRLFSIHSQQEISSTNRSIEGLKSGSYTLEISDSKGCAIRLQNYINIPSPPDCMASFTPNGDGIDDTFYIAHNGTARIYNRHGLLIRTLQVPAHWDGLEDSGRRAIMGYYVIVVNQREKLGVVLID